jgi:hypothetical protein
MKGMNDLIYEQLLEGQKGLTEAEIAERFLKIGHIDTDMARRIVEPLLSGDRRFTREGSVWKAVRLSTMEDLPLWHAPYLLFAIEECAEPVSGGAQIAGQLSRISSLLLLKNGETSPGPSMQTVLQDCNRYVFLPYDTGSLSRMKKIHRLFSPLEFEAKTLSLRRLLAHFYPDRHLKTWEDISQAFSILNYESSSVSSRTRTMAQVLMHILKHAQEEGVQRVGELIEISNRVAPSISFSRFEFGPELLKDLPECPGVYLFKNREGSVVYVGKTRNLRVRIGSYFRQGGDSEEKTAVLLQHLYSIEHRKLGSDLEALIEEFRLIEKHRPVLNKRVGVPERKVAIPKCIILLPSAEKGLVKLYFLSGGAPLMEQEYRPGTDLSGPFRAIRDEKGYLFDPLKIIALSYMRRYEEQLNIIGFDLYGGDEELLRAIDGHWQHRTDLEREKTRFVG